VSLTDGRGSLVEDLSIGLGLVLVETGEFYHNFLGGFYV